MLVDYPRIRSVAPSKILSIRRVRSTFSAPLRMTKSTSLPRICGPSTSKESASFISRYSKLILMFRPSNCARVFLFSTMVVALAMHSAFVRPWAHALSAACKAWISVGANFRPSKVRYAFREERARLSDGSRDVGIMRTLSGSGCENSKSRQRRLRSNACCISFWPK